MLRADCTYAATQAQSYLLVPNDRQDQTGRVFAIVIDGLLGRLDTPFLTQRSACVWVHVEAWKIAAADVQPGAMAGWKTLLVG
jgi:hypothetical protein